MSIISEIQNKALTEGRAKRQSKDSYKFQTVRPSSSLSALIEVLAFLDGKNPTDFIYSNFGKALEEFVLCSKDHVDPLKKAVTTCYKDLKISEFKAQSALGRLEQEGIIDCGFLKNLPQSKDNPRLLKHGFNKSVKDN